MKNYQVFQIQNIDFFKQQLILYAQNFDVFLILNSNHYPSKYEWLAALGVDSFFKFNNNLFEELYEWHKQRSNWLFGHFSYDIKNRIEPYLYSNNTDYIQFPEIYFFSPQIIIEISNGKVIYRSNHKVNFNFLHAKITQHKIEEKEICVSPFQKRIQKKEYLNNVKQLIYHIQQGDIYEINYCQEFYNDSFNANPHLLYLKITQKSPTPFSAFYKLNNRYLLCASPERYLKKEGNVIISQPMKGTIKRTGNESIDLQLKHQLHKSEKERAENIMIVDLVRNDLSITALKNSVQVVELCKVYEYPTVFQMISTIMSRISDNTKFTDVIKTSFPMGSMTGAPKIRAMQLIEEYESTKRGLFSGSVGYITPDDDFDFNVVIRSLQINQQNNYASIITGGAITIKSNPENEYEESILKTKALLNSINSSINIYE